MERKIPGTPEELRLHATARLLDLTVDEATQLLRDADLEAIAAVLRDHDTPATAEHVRELVAAAWRATAAQVSAWRGRIPWDHRQVNPVVFCLSGKQPLAGEWRLVGSGGQADVAGLAWPFPQVPHLRVTWGPETDWTAGYRGTGEPDWSAVYLHRYPGS